MSLRSARHCSARAEAAPRTVALGGGTVYLRKHQETAAGAEIGGKLGRNYGMRVIETVLEFPSLYSCDENVTVADSENEKGLAPASEHRFQLHRRFENAPPPPLQQVDLHIANF